MIESCEKIPIVSLICDLTELTSFVQWCTKFGCSWLQLGNKLIHRIKYLQAHVKQVYFGGWILEKKSFISLLLFSLVSWHAEFCYSYILLPIEVNCLFYVIMIIYRFKLLHVLFLLPSGVVWTLKTCLVLPLAPRHDETSKHEIMFFCAWVQCLLASMQKKPYILYAYIIFIQMWFSMSWI